MIDRPDESRRDRFIARLVSFLARMLYREIDVHWAGHVSPAAPQLTVASHFGGLTDALVLLDVLARRPGIVARDVIWKVPLVGRLMNWIGAIPVHKPEDGGGTESANDQMFASCYAALADRGHILIFPEGVTSDEPSIAPVKTGAARIVLGARARGTSGIMIQPVGIHYENKAALRSRVFVNAGVPLDLDRLVSEAPGDRETLDADDRDAVRDLTAAVDAALRRAAPQYVDWDEARSLRFGAEVALRSEFDAPGQTVPPALRERLANALADRPAAARARIIEAARTYRDDLEGLGRTDAELHGRVSRITAARLLAMQLSAGTLLLPFAIVGALINLIPFLVVKGVGLLRVAPSMHATIKPIVALVAFGLTWAAVIWRMSLEFGAIGGGVAFVLLPYYLAASIVFLERLVPVWHMIQQWRRLPGHGIANRLAAERSALVEAVFAA